MELNPLSLFVIAAVAAAGFAVVARRGKRNAAVWALCGALYGLVLATSVVGIGHAIALPYSDAVVSRHVTISAIISLLLLATSAGLALLVLRRFDTLRPGTSTEKDKELRSTPPAA